MSTLDPIDPQKKDADSGESLAPVFIIANETDKKKPLFLEKFKEVRTITQACRAFGLSRNTVLKWRKTDPYFVEKFEEIDRELFETLEVNAYKRALEGSDTLMIFLLKAGDPKYREYIRHEIDHRFVVDVSAQVTGVIRRLVLDSCPNCKTHFGIVNKIALELEGLSARLAPQ